MRTYFCEKKSLENFSFVTLPLEILEKNKASVMEILQNCVTLFGNSKPKTIFHGNSTWIFLNQPWKFHIFFIEPLEFPHATLLMPLEIFHGINPLNFSEIAQCYFKYHYLPIFLKPEYVKKTTKDNTAWSIFHKNSVFIKD